MPPTLPYARGLAAVLSVTLAAGCTRATPPAAGPAPTGGPAATRPAAGAPASGGPGGPGGAAAAPRPYARVITPEARTSSGMFRTHRVADKLYFEIPARELRADMLILPRAAGGESESVVIDYTRPTMVRWERDGNRVLLRQQLFQVGADTSLAIARGVAAQRVGAIIASFPVEAYGPDSAPVVDVTRLFTSNIPELVGVPQIQGDRSFVDRVVAFPENVEVDVTQTGMEPPVPPGPGRVPRTVTQLMHYSIVKLPAQPMMPRLADRRVGFISTSFTDYGRPDHEAKLRSYIHRFRLEKQNPSAAVSDPVTPIVFWIDPATPEWLVPYVKEGIEQWNAAYREAGFSNAIEGRLAPTPEQDSTFSLFDARHSVIYWRASRTPNATGGQIVDPRSGEIVKAEVNMFHNIMDLQRRWYFTQVAPIDARARTLPLPDSLMGRLVEYVVAHEVGHAIGFPHNMKSSSQYPVDSLRSAAFLRRMGGHVATLMDYSRFNYVAQPEDSIPVELLIPRVGPYDHYAVMWGHTPIPGARTPDDELPTLDRWARMQDTIPWFRFSTMDATGDPGNLTEAVGDADAVRASGLALKNLERVMGYMLAAAERPGEDYTLLSGLYGEAVGQWGRYNSHVAAVVAGAESQERYGTGPRFTPLPKARQREAVRFLSANAFTVPTYLLDADILRRIEQEGAVRRVRTEHARVLGVLLNYQRLNRLVEYEALAEPGEAYTVADLLGDVRRGVWTELSTGSPRVDVFRRNLQRAYLDVVDQQLNPPPAPAMPAGFPAQPPRYPSDARAVLRGELVELDQLAQRALTRTNDPMTRLHLRDVRLEISRLLDTDR